MVCRPSTPQEWLMRPGRVVVSSPSFVECRPPSFVGCRPRHSLGVVPVIRWVSSPSFVGCRPRHSSNVVPVIHQVSSPSFIKCRPPSFVGCCPHRLSSVVPRHPSLFHPWPASRAVAREARGGWCIVVCRPSLSSLVICCFPVVCRLSSPWSFVVFVVVRPWCTHNPPDEQSAWGWVLC
jgi:hypothetical protein